MAGYIPLANGQPYDVVLSVWSFFPEAAHSELFNDKMLSFKSLGNATIATVGLTM
jgi:hypothetical protein